MKLLVALFKYFPFGGLQKDTLRIVQEAVRRGHEVTVLTTHWGEDEVPGVRYVRVPVRGWTNTGRMGRFGEAFRKMAASWDGVTLAMNRIPGADFYFAADACMAVALTRKRGYAWKRFLPRYRSILRQEAAVFDSAVGTRYLLISGRQLEEYRRVYPAVPDGRYVMLPPGIDERAHRHAVSSELRSRLRAECGAGENDRLLVTVGTNLRLKGVDRVLDALRQLPCSVKYAVIGNDSAEAFSRMAAEHGVDAGRVRHLGTRKNVPDYLCSADLMVHLAREEGAGSVLLEGLSCGLPVVCTAVCGFSPYVSEADGRWVIPEPYSDSVCVEALSSLLSSLPQQAARASVYASEHDFTARAGAVVSLLEASQETECVMR